MTSSRRGTWKSNKAAGSFLLFLLLLVLAFGKPVSAQALSDLGLSGSLRAAEWQKDKSFREQDNYAVGGLWLQARPRELYGVKSYFDARVQSEDLARGIHSSGDLREAYVESSMGDFDFRVGRQIAVWGRADKVNPTDVWSSKNLRLLTTDDEDQRMGSFATQIAYVFGNYRLIAYWQPEWREPQYPIPEIGGGRVRLVSPRPEGASRQMGFKIDHSGGELDWSVSYAHVLDRTPDLKVLSAGPTGADVGLNYQMIDVLGADMARNFGDYGVRAEVSHARTKDSDGLDPTTKNRAVFGVVGVDRSLFGNLNVNLQYVHRHAFDWRDADDLLDPQIRALAQQVSVLSFQREADFRAGSLRVNYKALHETLDMEIAGFGWWNNGVLRPKVTYSFTDSLRGILGGEFYGGDADSFFGRLKPNSSGFVEFRYLF